MVIGDFCRWMFSSHPGIYATDRRSRFIRYRPDGPTAHEIVVLARAGRRLRVRKCVGCGANVWAWQKVKVCGRFSCFRKNGGKWL